MMYLGLLAELQSPSVSFSFPFPSGFGFRASLLKIFHHPNMGVDLGFGIQ